MKEKFKYWLLYIAILLFFGAVIRFLWWLLTSISSALV